MATLNFDEETLKADGGSLYDLYLALYNGSVAANKDIPSDSDFLVLDAEGNVDEDATSDKVSSYNTILMKNAAYSEANAIISNVGGSGSGGSGSSDVTLAMFTRLSNSVTANTTGKFGYHRIYENTNGDSILQEFADEASCKLYDGDNTKYAALLLSSLTLPSGGSNTGISYYLRCVNNLTSLSMSVAKNDECDINFTFVSKYKYPDDTGYTNTDENGRVEIYISNSKYSDYTLATTFELASNTAKNLDIHEYLENGTNMVKVSITGLNTGKTAAAIIYTVQVTSMSLSAPNFKWYNPFTSSIIVPFIISGNVSKSLIVNVTGNNYSKAYTVNIGTAVYTDTAYNYNVELPTDEGVYNISAYLQNSDASVKTKAVSWNIIYVTADSTGKYMCVNSVSQKAYNWAENSLFTYSIYDAGKTVTSADITVKKGDTTLYDSTESNIETGVSHTFSLSMELDISDTSFNIIASVKNIDGTSLTSDMTFPVDNSAGYSASANSVFYLNPRTRSNSQSNYMKVVNAVDNSELAATWTGMSWANDGWQSDTDNFKLLRLISGGQVDIPYQPFATESAKIGKTIEIDYKVTNVTDYSKPIVTMAKDAADGSSFVGLKIYPDNIYPCSASLINENNQSIPTDTDVRIRLTMVILPDAYGNSGYNLAMLFINGKRNRVFAYVDNDYWQAIGDIVIGNDNADIDVYGLRVYDFGLTSTAVLQNYVNWLPTTDDKKACVEDNSIYENDGVTISFTKMKTMKNVFTFDKPFPYKGNKASVTGNLEVFFLNETTTRKSFSITNVTAGGQGTSSKTYWEWNEKFAIGSTSVITYSDGTTGSKKVLFGDGVPKCAKMTAKKNWASSMQDHKAGSVNSYTDLWKKVGLSNEAVDVDSEVRVSVYQEPFIGFYKTVNDEGQTVYTCMGEFTFGPDKGDKYCFGYDTTAFPDLISIEGSDNAPAHALFQKPWNDSVAYNSDEEAFQYNGTNCWDFDGGNTDNIKYWIPVYNFVYNCSNLILPFNGTLDELNAAKEAYMSTGYQYWVAKDGDANQYNLYYYDEVTQQFVFSINLKTQLIGQTFTYTDGDTAKTVSLTESDITSATDNNAVNTLFVNARIAMFGQGITSRFDLNDSLFHDAFIEFVAGTDNRAKNTYTYLFSGTGLWRWRVDDLDTIFPIDNEGKLHKPYWVETHDMDTTGKAYWNGEKSVFHNLLELAYPNAQKAMVGKMIDAMISLGELKTGTYREKIYAWYEKYYLGVKEYFPEAIINADQKRYDNAKLLDTQASVDPLSQSLGDLYSCETSWVKKRIEYMMSKYSYGEYSSAGTDVISFRAAGDKITYDLTPAIKLYPTIENGTTIVRGARTEAGKVCSITINLLGTGDQPNVIEGASYLMSIGDFSGKNIEGAMAVSAKMLKELTLGNDTAENVVISISSLSLTGCVSLQTLKLTNVSSLAGALDLTSCTHLKKVYASGTTLTQITLPTGSATTYIQYPATNKYLLIKKMPVLENSGMIISDCADKIIDLLVVDCPKIDSIDLLLNILAAQTTSDHALKHIRVSGFTHTYTTGGASIIDRLVAITDGTYAGLSYDGVADSSVYPRPILSGTINVHANCYRDTVTSLRTYFGSQLELNTIGEYYVRFKDDKVRQVSADNWGDGIGAYESNVYVLASIGTQFAGNTEIADMSDMASTFKAVSVISSGAFKDCSSLNSIVLPTTLTEIDDSAFSGTSISSLSLPNNVVKAYLNGMSSLSALTLDSALQELSLVNDAKMIGTFDATALNSITKLLLSGTGYTGVSISSGSSIEEISLPASLKLLLLKNLTSLNTITSDGYENITDLLVTGCTSIESFPLFYAIYNAQSGQTTKALTYFYVDGINSSYTDETVGTAILNSLLDITKSGAFHTLTIDGVENSDANSVLNGTLSIAANTYQDVVDSLKAYFDTLTLNVTGKVYLRFEDSAVEAICAANWGDGTGITTTQAAVVSSIGTKFSKNTKIITFKELSYFTNVTYLQGSNSSANPGAFNGCTSLKKIILPSSITDIQDGSFYNCAITYINLENIKTLGYNCFTYCPLNMELNMPNLTGIFTGFAGTNITKIIDLGKVTSIVGSGDSCHTNGAALGSCHYLTEVILPDTMTSITGMIDCTALEKVSFNNNVTIIGDSTFEGCTKLTSIGDVSNVTSIGNRAFYNCTKLTSIGDVSNVTSIGSSSFNGCSSLKSFDIGKIIKIPNWAFRGCTSLETIDLTNVTYIGDEVFYNCSSLKNIGSLEKITYIGNYSTFNNCSSLVIDLNLPNLTTLNGSFSGSGILNIISLGTVITLNNNFTNCKNLKTVILPSTLQSINSYIFSGCSSLLWIKLLSETVVSLTNPYWADSTNSTFKIYVPDNLVESYKSATNWSNYSSRIKGLSTFTQ